MNLFYRFRRLSTVILNVLRLVNDFCVKLVIPIQRNVPFCHIVGRNPDIGILSAPYQFLPLLYISHNEQRFQFRRKPLYFPLPVVDQRGGADNQMWKLRLSLLFPVQQIRDCLQRFSKPHIVCQNPAKPQICQRVQPLEAKFLIFPQDSSQVLRFLIIAVLHIFHIPYQRFIVGAALCLKLSVLLAEHLIYVTGPELGDIQRPSLKVLPRYSQSV